MATGVCFARTDKRVLWRSRLTGGSNCVDGITGMIDGDVTHVFNLTGTLATMYTYIYDADNSGAENSPQIIEPDDASVGAWVLAGQVTKAFRSEHKITAKTSNYPILVSDGGTIFTNTGATANVTFTLPECESEPGNGEVGEGWWVAFKVTDTSHEFYVDPDAQDSIKDFSSGEAGEYIYGDQTLGSMIKLTCTQCDSIAGTEEDAYNFVSDGYVGTWTTQD